MSHYQHRNIKEQESILKFSSEEMGIRAIGLALGRSAATISRELRRNRSKDGYWPDEATKKYRRRRTKYCRKRILDMPEIRSFVQRKILEEQWSPEQIASRTKLENSAYRLSYPTIYRTIYAGRLETHKLSHDERGIARKLRHRGKTRRRKGEEETRGKLRISHPIEERPQAANDRSEFGHWGADTVAGKVGSSCLITLTCRKSRLLLSLIAPDRGKEFARHTEISAALGGIPFYFPPLHAPWERGTNENTNSLIRECCPKSVDLESFVFSLPDSPTRSICGLANAWVRDLPLKFSLKKLHDGGHDVFSQEAKDGRGEIAAIGDYVKVDSSGGLIRMKRNSLNAVIAPPEWIHICKSAALSAPGKSEIRTAM